MRVTISVTEAADVVASEPPSTATTEYATRLRTGGCLGYAWGFSGKAWEKSFKEQSANMSRKDLRYMTEANALGVCWKSLKGRERGSTRESRYFRDREIERREERERERERERGQRDLRSMQTQGKRWETENLNTTISLSI